ncbi:hypothetical protein [Brucella cytisi]|uniref:hypothetical protein n=1 Tax=Brucella cytisi TaxID=407152 RepID=UPI00313AF193
MSFDTFLSNDTILGLFGHYVAFGAALLTFLNDPSFCVGPKLRHNLGALISSTVGFPLSFPPLTGPIEALQIELGTIAEHVAGSVIFAIAEDNYENCDRI